MHRGISIKKGLLENFKSTRLLTHKTIFDDRTEQSDYTFQQLVALEPSKSAVEVGHEDLIEAPELEERSEVNDVEVSQATDRTEDSIRKEDTSNTLWHSSFDPDVLDDYYPNGKPAKRRIKNRTRTLFKMPDISISPTEWEPEATAQRGSSRHSREYDSPRLDAQRQVQWARGEQESQAIRFSNEMSTVRAYVDNDSHSTNSDSGLRRSERDLDSDLMGLESASKELLLKTIARLAAENDDLKQNTAKTGRPAEIRFQAPTAWQTMYRVDKGTFLKKPSWSSEESGVFTLKPHAPVSSTAEYLKRHESIAFVEFKYYKSGATLPASAQWGGNEVLPEPQPYKESVKLASTHMTEAMSSLLANLPHFAENFPEFDASAELPAPYLFWYQFRDHIDESIEALTAEHKSLIVLFRSWIEEAYGSEWQYVDAQLSQGLISPITMKYLVRVQDVLVTNKNGHIESYMAKGRLKFVPTSESAREGQTQEELQGRAARGTATAMLSSLSGDPSDLSNPPPKISYLWSVESWRWSFDGSFRQAGNVLSIKIDSTSVRDTVPITSLEAFPLDFADEKLRETLKKRGDNFWKCRKRLLVSYTDPDGDEMSAGTDRYMVDVATYHQFRRRKEKAKLSNTYRLEPQSDSIGDSSASRHEQDGDAQVGPARFDWNYFPECPELFVFPRTVIAYDLRRKTWTDLDVDRIRDVTWNREAFESLAIGDEEKELIQALVTKQIAPSKGTDIIADKGSGLIMLLHGGPGTGKTFTAESIADFARKPLYRVTCGDIGTNPEQVEVYLESVLHLGSLWDCVVLLDEADVFLESRSQADLARNALVSVFLRILEYYQGILILTSNRVGSFDEAFKSRIQLALYYQDLSQPQRRKIWRNFIGRLKALGETSVDYDDIDDHIDVLVNYEMNGRQIRNTITTARQLAQYREQNMRFSHLEHVIKVSERFETYIREVKSNMTDADLKRMEGQR